MTSISPNEPAVRSVAALKSATIMTPALTLFFAAAVAIIVLNLFASQPLIGLIGPALGMSTATASLVTTLTLFGYAAGLVFLVPLVDLIANRRLIILTLAVCVISLGLASIVPSASLFLVTAVAIGFASTAIQMLVPIAAALAAPAQRGRVVGNVMSGLMIGTLLSRPVASLVAESFGWRAFYALTAVLIAVLTVVLAKILPERQPPRGLRYGALIASLPMLLRQEPILRRRSAYQFLLMAAFSVFWTVVALRLSASPFDLGQRGIALFAMVAAGAVIISPIAGRLADRGWTRSMTCLLQGSVVLSMILTAVADGAGSLWQPADAPLLSLAILSVAAFLLSLGVTGDQILGRHAINMLNPDARGRINGLYTGLMFLGGSLGAFIAGPAWAYGGWPLVYIVGFCFSFLALVLSVCQRR